MEADERLIYQLMNGYRMEKPKYATNAIGELMKNCWEDEPSDRPNFTQLVDTFGSLLESTVHRHTEEAFKKEKCPVCDKVCNV